MKKILLTSALCAKGILMLNKFRKYLFLTLLTSTTSVWACNSSHVLGAGGSGAVYTMSADTMKEGDFYIGINTESLQNNPLSDERIKFETENGAEHIHGIDAINMHSVSLSYGITDVLTLNVLLPYMETINVRAGELVGDQGEIHPHGDVNGIGDISTLLQYKILDDEKNKIALLAGIKVPTGKTDIQDEGEVLELDLQPGSGSWDYYAGAVLSKEFNDFSLHSNILYKYTTKGDLDSELGNVFSYNLAFSYKLIDEEPAHDFIKETPEEHEAHNDNFDFSVDIFLEFNGEYVQENEEHGIAVENTGGNVIFMTTGFQLITNKSYSAFFAVGIPIYENYNGIQNESKYKATIGIGKSF